jgi:hypothetical protein
MDEPKKTDQFNGDGSDTPQGGNVMDIQSPKPASDTAPNLPNYGTGTESLETSGGTTTSTSEAGIAQPVAEPAPTPATSNNSADFAAALASEPDSPASGQPAEPAPNPLAIPPHATHKGKGPVVAIAVALVVALVLAGLVVFTYTNGKKNTAGTNSNAGPAPVVSKPLASPADVDSTTQELESSLNKIDTDKDFSSEELSDKSLGL